MQSGCEQMSQFSTEPTIDISNIIDIIKIISSLHRYELLDVSYEIFRTLVLYKRYDLPYPEGECWKVGATHNKLGN